MAYNKAREEQKWKKWKEREEEKLRELGMDEVSIQVLHESDWADAIGNIKCRFWIMWRCYWQKQKLVKRRSKV